MGGSQDRANDAWLTASGFQAYDSHSFTSTGRVRRVKFVTVYLDPSSPEALEPVKDLPEASAERRVVALLCSVQKVHQPLLRD